MNIKLVIVANNEKDQTQEVINTIAKLVRSGDIEREQIVNIYDRIKKFKQKKL